MTLLVPIGISGSGKSGWASMFHAHATVISSDSIRRESGQDDPWDEFHARIADQLDRGKLVIADATNLAKERRATLLELADERYVAAHAFLFTNADDAWTRNFARGDPVPERAMIRQLNQLIRTIDEITGEAFATVTFVKNFHGSVPS